MRIRSTLLVAPLADASSNPRASRWPREHECLGLPQSLGLAAAQARRSCAWHHHLHQGCTATPCRNRLSGSCVVSEPGSRVRGAGRHRCLRRHEGEPDPLSRPCGWMGDALRRARARARHADRSVSLSPQSSGASRRRARSRTSIFALHPLRVVPDDRRRMHRRRFSRADAHLVRLALVRRSHRRCWCEARRLRSHGSSTREGTGRRRRKSGGVHRRRDLRGPARCAWIVRPRARTDQRKLADPRAPTDKQRHSLGEDARTGPCASSAHPRRRHTHRRRLHEPNTSGMMLDGRKA